MEVNFTITKSDLKDYYKTTNRNTFIAWGVVILIALGLTIMGAVLSEDNIWILGVFIIAFSALFLLLTILKILTVYKNSLKSAGNEVSLEIDPEFLKIKKSGKIRWEYIFDLLEYNNFFIVKLNKNSVFLIPKRALDAQAQSLLKDYFKEGLKKRKTLKNKK
ncbi:MAG TPA: YcxB family protein [Clostridia bacterium]|jgi:hypothetical protein